MSELADDEIFSEIESFFVSNLQEHMSGTGLKYDMDVFTRLRKFLNHLHAKHHISLGVVESQSQIRGMSHQQVEDCYKEATRESLSYNEIMKNLHIFVLFLNEMKFENKGVFDGLRKKGMKFAKFLKTLYENDVGKKHQHLISDLERKFKEFNEYLEFYTQQSTGFEEHLSMSDVVEEDGSDDLFMKLRQLQQVMRRI